MGKSIIQTIKQLWEENIKGRWESSQGNYVFDILLTRDMSRGHILDFNPYAPKTDSLLFSYDELFRLLQERKQAFGDIHQTLPALKVINSPSHPAANSTAPLHQHNMMPFEALSLSNGRDIEQFAELWRDELEASLS